MPPLEYCDLWQKAVLWQVSERSGSYGDFQTGNPVEVSCRWVEKQTMLMDKQGNTISVDGTVVVSVEVRDGSRMWLGRLKQLVTGKPPVDVSSGRTNWMQVKNLSRTPDLKARTNRYELALMRFRDPA